MIWVYRHLSPGFVSISMVIVQNTWAEYILLFVWDFKPLEKDIYKIAISSNWIEWLDVVLCGTGLRSIWLKYWIVGFFVWRLTRGRTLIVQCGISGAARIGHLLRGSPQVKTFAFVELCPHLAFYLFVRVICKFMYFVCPDCVRFSMWFNVLIDVIKMGWLICMLFILKFMVLRIFALAVICFCRICHLLILMRKY